MHDVYDQVLEYYNETVQQQGDYVVQESRAIIFLMNRLKAERGLEADSVYKALLFLLALFHSNREPIRDGTDIKDIDVRERKKNLADLQEATWTLDKCGKNDEIQRFKPMQSGITRDGDANLIDILVIDDDPGIVELLVMSFHAKMIRASGLTYCKDFKQAVKNIMPKVILLDVNMPSISGFDLCRLIKQDKCTSSIKVYMMTAMPYEVIQENLQLSEADGYFLKPFGFSELDTIIASL